VTVLAEERDAAYDRVGPTGYTEHWDRSRLALPGNDYAGDRRVELILRDPVTRIDSSAKCVTTLLGRRVSYDALVLATGSHAFVPPVPGHDLPNCHVYRTLDDLDAIRADAHDAADGAAGVVIGGGLLGLEAANALRQFGLRPHIVERFRRLMGQQLDEAVADQETGLRPRRWCLSRRPRGGAAGLPDQGHRRRRRRGGRLERAKEPAVGRIRFGQQCGPRGSAPQFDGLNDPVDGELDDQGRLDDEDRMVEPVE
jgi:hypothetical protein